MATDALNILMTIRFGLTTGGKARKVPNGNICYLVQLLQSRLMLLVYPYLVTAFPMSCHLDFYIIAILFLLKAKLPTKRAKNGYHILPSSPCLLSTLV